MVMKCCQAAQEFHESDAATQGCFAENPAIVRSGAAPEPLRYGQLDASITSRRDTLDASKPSSKRIM